MRRVLPLVAIGLGCLLLVLGAIAGVANRQVLDGPRFARNVDAIRSDPAVAREVGRAIARRVLQLDPDLVAVRPVVESVSIALAGSPSLRPVVLRAAAQLHSSLTSPGSGPVVLRLADVGAVLTASLRTLAPNVAAGLPSDFDVTLARLGSGTFAERSVRAADRVALLSWLLPLLGLVLLGAGVATSPDQLGAGARACGGVAVGGAVLGSVTFAAGIVAGNLDDDPGLRPALWAAAWHQLDSPLWWASAILLTSGAVGVLVCAQLGAPAVPGVERGWRTLLSPSTTTGLLGRAALAALGGLALLNRPESVLRLVAGVAGIGLLLRAVGDLLAARAASAARWRLPRRLVVPLLLLPPVLVLVGLVAVNAGTGGGALVVAPARSGACNGHRQLCDRPYDEVAFAATHNSMTAADENWFLPEQPTGIIGQLDDGIRVFLIDSWYGQPTNRASVVATAEGSRPAATKEANEAFGADVVQAALRVRDAADLAPTGPRAPYLCHGLCELGATRWDTEMTKVRRWVEAHPREVVTFFVQDEVSPTATNDVFRTAGLLPYVRTQAAGQPWPTLRQMISSKRRVVVLMERQSGGTTYPWQLPGFDWVQDTPFSNPSVADLSCRLQRGAPDHPILLINHWLSGFRSLVSDARLLNSRGVLLPELRRCEKERGQLPNFVAVNYYNEGDLFSVIDELNGV